MDSSPIRSIIIYVYKQDENHEKLKIYKTKKRITLMSQAITIIFSINNKVECGVYYSHSAPAYYAFENISNITRGLKSIYKTFNAYKSEPVDYFKQSLQFITNRPIAVNAEEVETLVPRSVGVVLVDLELDKKGTPKFDKATLDIASLILEDTKEEYIKKYGVDDFNSIPVYEEPIDFTNFPLNKAEELIDELPDRWYDKKNNFVFYQMN